MKRSVVAGHALAAVFAALAPSTGAAAGYDGRYVGVITCETIPGVTTQRLKTEFTMTVAEGQAEYSRDLLQVDSAAKTGVTERGAGSVSSSGEVTLLGSASAPTWRYEATYRGRIEGERMHLKGGQAWQIVNRTPYTRPCAIDVSRAR